MACDPQLVSINEWKEWKEILDQSDKQLVPISVNLVDLLWNEERPALPDNAIWTYPLEFAGL